MSKKMRRVALESSPYVVFEDKKARLKHKTLLQDYQELHKETNGMRDKLEDAKLRKQRLLAEVHFLRRRHKYLLQMKSSSHPEQQERAALLKSEFFCKKGMKDRFPSKREAKLHKLPPLPGTEQKARIQVAKEASLQKMPSDILVNALPMGKDAVQRSTVSSLKHKSRVYSGKEVLLPKAAPAFDLNQNNRSVAGNGFVSRSIMPVFDLNQETGHGRKDVVLPTRARAPVIDLNEISVGEEEPQANFEPVNFEEPKRGLIQNMNDDQHRDLKLSICRNVGEGTSRVEKRKISWQDPVALRV